MSLSYPVLGEYTGSVQSGSYLSPTDTSLFYVSQSTDIWFGISKNDVIELGVYSIDDKTLLNWSVLNQSKEFKTVNLSYIDSLNSVKNYSYQELVKPFTVYKNNSILFKPYDDLSSVGITEGTYDISYNFVREMAGTPTDPLSIKEISPSRTEVKLIPLKKSDIQYDSFCVKKFPIRDVAPVLLSIAKSLPYDKIYKEMSSIKKYKSGVDFIKFAFFLVDDGSVVEFLRNLYEDLIKYTSILRTDDLESTTIKRVQGIRTYYANFLLQNYDFIADFNDIDKKFTDFVNLRLDERFNQLLKSQNQGYKDARQFCYDFFVVYFYRNYINPLKDSYHDKYFGYFKNVLNFGNNKYFHILNHGFLDERKSPDDDLTLIIKLSSAIPSDVIEKDNCWVSNFGMTPYVFTSILQNPIKYKTFKIASPNFGSPQHFINKEGANVMYSSDDLDTQSTNIKDSIEINKTISELNTDYSNYDNFIVFSSVKNRLDIFKNKITQWTMLDEALSELDRRYYQSLSSSVVYPYYSKEYVNITTQLSDLINSFDGYESYLFKSGNYRYIPSSSSFYSSSYVEEQDVIAREYDINNRDSLIANTPQYITTNGDYEEYLTFLNMVGHHFDNIYTYISALPIERQVKNELTSSIPTKILKEMLYSFGWNVDDIIGSLNLDEVYLNSMDSSSYNALSGQDRLQTIWNRILINLPAIYKTKGTTECVNYLMACYGLPSSMITVREYGGTDFADDTITTYQLDEKSYMLTFSGIGDYVEGPIPYSAETIEFKFSIDQNISKSYYEDYRFFPLLTSTPYPYTSSAYINWMLGFYKVPGQYTGRVVFQMGSGSSGTTISSSVLPIFNGDIFSVMLRRNEPSTLFEYSPNPDVIPLQYDLYVQRNESGRKTFYSTSSAILYNNDNNVFSQFGRFKLTNGTFKGTLDKVSIWDIPIGDDDFEEHVNDINSYGFSGSMPLRNLWVRLNWDYPQNMFYESASASKVWVDNRSVYYTVPNYYTDQTLTTKNSQSYSASLDIIQNRWQTYYPTGSVDIIAYNWPRVIEDSFSSSFCGYPTCSFVSQSVYPYHFKELTYQQDIDASKYGPNKYKNKKIRKIEYDVDARFDVYNRSTSEPNLTISGESNQLGFFIDPQDSKNKDILRYVGKDGIMELIGDPANLYSDRYENLRNKNIEYNYNGNKKTYFNELLTIYKFYFDKSIFQAIKNVLPARANAYTGVVVEPTILERPKYQNKPISSSVELSYKTPAVINNIYTFDMDLLWSDFNVDYSVVSDPSNKLANSMPPNYQKVLDLSNLTLPTRNLPANLLDGGYVMDYMDRVQHNFYPDFEELPRNWETYTIPIYGSVSAQDEEGRFMVGPDHGVADATRYYLGSNQNNHPTIYYIVKVWEKFYYYAKTGNYVRSDNPKENLHSSAFVYLYKYVIFDEYYMRNLVYFTNGISLPPYDVNDISYNYDYGINSYLHKINTFIGTPDKSVSNVLAIENILTQFNKTDFDLGLSTTSKYFELASGYPRNHYTHKLQQFSKNKYGTYNNDIFIKGRNTLDSTINTNGINDGTYPVQSFGTSNVNVVNSSNVIQNVPSTVAGQITPSGGTTTTGTGGTTGGSSTGGGSPPSGGGCLIAGTKIRMDDNILKNVEDVKIGDVLLGYNELYVSVVELKPSTWNEYYVINGHLKITWEHPVLIRKEIDILTIVKDLRVGDKMIKYNDEIETINSIIIISGHTPTYNFVVDKNHLYIAEDIVVHNPLIQKF